MEQPQSDINNDTAPLKRGRGRPRTTPGDNNLFIRGLDHTSWCAFSFLCGSRPPAVVFAKIVREAFKRRAETNEHAKALFERLYRESV